MQLIIELGGEGFVGRNHQSRLVYARYDVRHRKGLPRAGDP